MMRTTVVKKVTASHDIVHGSSSTEINATTNMMPTTVVKKDTASQDSVPRDSSSAAKINKPKQGFQHVYRSSKTTLTPTPAPTS
jgi:hypothetical protein